MLIFRIKKAKTRKTATTTHRHNKKKRLILDTTIELDMDTIMDGVKNTSSIIKCPTYLPCSRKMKQLQGLRELNLDEFSISGIPKALRFMFDAGKITHVKVLDEVIPQEDHCKVAQFNDS